MYLELGILCIWIQHSKMLDRDMKGSLFLNYTKGNMVTHLKP